MATDHFHSLSSQLNPLLPSMETRLLYLFTRTPLHVGAGASVGAIDQPIQRERHTGYPIIPGSTLKGVFADQWTEIVNLPELKSDGSPELDEQEQPKYRRQGQAKPERNWLFGREAKTGELTAGALQFGEARLLAFPIRSARGCFAWLTSPMLLRRAVRDRVLDLTEGELDSLQSGLTDETARFTESGPLALNAENDPQVVLEEYAFKRASAVDMAASDVAMEKAGTALRALMSDDLVWQEIATRLVVLTDGMMSFFATTACEVAQHVRIDDATGTADPGGLFNQENVPSETLFYAVIHAQAETGKQLKDSNQNSREPRSASEALSTFWPTDESRVFQFGADGSTGLGYCTVRAVPLN